METNIKDEVMTAVSRMLGVAVEDMRNGKKVRREVCDARAVATYILYPYYEKKKSGTLARYFGLSVAALHMAKKRVPERLDLVQIVNQNAHLLKK